MPASQLFGALTRGAATSELTLLFKKTGIADNTATAILTVTVPNVAQSAKIYLDFLSSNGSTDAFESSRQAYGSVIIARTAAGVDTVATAVALWGEAIATVAAGATHTLAYAVTAMVGASSATQTFTVTVTINDSGNLGSNQIMVKAVLMNAEGAQGVTMATA